MVLFPVSELCPHGVLQAEFGRSLLSPKPGWWDWDSSGMLLEPGLLRVLHDKLLWEAWAVSSVR